MRFNRKWFLLFLCLLCGLLLTGCYTDTDPWPAADDLSSAAVTSTPSPSPTTAPTAAPAPVPTEVPQTATPEPLPEDAVDVSPNFNG